MKPSKIVHGGGWVKRQTLGRPKTQLFALLSLIWLGVPISASVPFWHDAWPTSFSGAEWLCLIAMLPETVFIILAIKFALTEQPRTITSYDQNPNHDLRKLY